MGSLAIGMLAICLMLWAYDTMLNDSAILSLIKKMLFPVGEWLHDLFGLEPDHSESTGPFVVSEYLARIEKASLDILESRKPTDKTIVLWLGVYGLRLNEDGTMKWVSRKKPAEAVFYQPCQTIRPDVFLVDQTQSTMAQIDALMARNMSLQVQSRQSAQIENTLQQFCVQTVAQYPPYYYGGRCVNPVREI